MVFGLVRFFPIFTCYVDCCVDWLKLCCRPLLLWRRQRRELGRSLVLTLLAITWPTWGCSRRGNAPEPTAMRGIFVLRTSYPPPPWKWSSEWGSYNFIYLPFSLLSAYLPSLLRSPFAADIHSLQISILCRYPLSLLISTRCRSPFSLQISILSSDLSKISH